MSFGEGMGRLLNVEEGMLEVGAGGELCEGGTRPVLTNLAVDSLAVLGETVIDGESRLQISIFDFSQSGVAMLRQGGLKFEIAQDSRSFDAFDTGFVLTEKVHLAKLISLRFTAGHDPNHYFFIITWSTSGLIL